MSRLADSNVYLQEDSSVAELQQLRSENDRLASLRQKDQARVATLTKELRALQAERQTVRLVLVFVH